MLVTKGCDIENRINVKENPVQVAKERCSISQNVIFNANSSSKFNAECITELKRIRVNIINNVKCKHYLNVNSLVSKFDKLKVIGQGVFDVLTISKTKLNASYPVAQFCINDF